MAYRLLADTALFVHFAFVLFVVLGLAAILVGGRRAWGWVRNRAFRIAHLAAIGVVAEQAWLGILCPLTRLEVWARERVGEATYSGGFIAHWVERALYYRAPPWVFVLAYTLFAALVVLAWYRIPPAESRAGR